MRFPSQVYSIANHNLCLVGTAEIPLAGMYADQIIPAEQAGAVRVMVQPRQTAEGGLVQLPVRMVAVGHCFRTEAGERGKENRGLYRVVRSWRDLFGFSFLSSLVF